MYGLKQAAILAYKLIKERLIPAGYYLSTNQTGYGNTKQELRYLHYASITLALSILVKMTQIILLTRSVHAMISLFTGKERIIAV